MSEPIGLFERLRNIEVLRPHMEEITRHGDGVSSERLESLVNSFYWAIVNAEEGSEWDMASNTDRRQMTRLYNDLVH